jgi:hypothetical protein
MLKIEEVPKVLDEITACSPEEIDRAISRIEEERKTLPDGQAMFHHAALILLLIVKQSRRGLVPDPLKQKLV